MAEHPSAVYAKEWEVYCRKDYEEYVKANPPPKSTDFVWSPSLYHNAFARWAGKRRQRYMELGDAWWRERGFTVIDWPTDGRPILLGALKKEE